MNNIYACCCVVGLELVTWIDSAANEAAADVIVVT